MDFIIKLKYTKYILMHMCIYNQFLFIIRMDQLYADASSNALFGLRFLLNNLVSFPMLPIQYKIRLPLFEIELNKIWNCEKLLFSYIYINLNY